MMQVQTSEVYMSWRENV